MHNEKAQKLDHSVLLAGPENAWISTTFFCTVLLQWVWLVGNIFVSNSYQRLWRQQIHHKINQNWVFWGVEKSYRASPPGRNLVGPHYLFDYIRLRWELVSIYVRFCESYFSSTRKERGVPSLWPRTFFALHNPRNLTLVRPLWRELSKNRLDFWNLQENRRNVESPYFLAVTSSSGGKTNLKNI